MRPASARPVWSALARVWDHLLGTPAGFTSPPPVALSCQPALLVLEDRVTPDGRPLPYPYVFTGTATGDSRVRAYHADSGALAFERQVFDPAFTGGVRLATADINQDTLPDLVVAAGPGGGPHVRVLDGKTGNQITGPLGSFFAYDPAFAGGVWVAAGDVDGDKVPDVITAAGAGGGPHVKVFSGATGTQIGNFFAFDPNFAGGVSVSAADYTGDGKADLVVGAGAGGGPHVKVLDLNAGPEPVEVRSFFAFDPNFTGGVSVAGDWLAGDLTGDGRVELVVGAGPGGGPHVKVFDGVTNAEVRSFFAYSPNFTGGVQVGTAFVDDDGVADVVASTISQAGAVRVFRGDTLARLSAPLGEYTPFGAGYTGGVSVAAGNDPAVVAVVADPFFYDQPYSGGGGAVAGAAGAGMTGPLTSTDAGVRDDGAVAVGLAAMSGDKAARGVRLGGGISWTNAVGYADGLAGDGTTADDLTRLVPYGPALQDGYALVDSAGSALFFAAQSGGGFLAPYGHPATLTASAGAGELIVADGQGGTLTFYDFSGGTPTGRGGRLKSRTDAAGNVLTTVSWDAAGRPTELQATEATSATTESLVYAYTGGGLVNTITRRRKVGAGAFATVRTLTMAYGTVAGVSGSVLTGATETTAGGGTVGEWYYRYYATGDPNGYAGGLKYAFNPESTARLKGALGTSLSTLTDAQVAPYADAAYQYNADKRATLVANAGAGNSAITYGANATTAATRIDWVTRATEARADGTVVSVYANNAGQTLARVVTANGGSQVWVEYWRYDAAGRVILHANPSAVNGFDENLTDLVGYGGGSNATKLNDSTGLIETFTYGASTTANDTTAGDVAGYLKSTFVQKGELGTPVKQSDATYIARTAAGRTTYRVASETAYRDAGGGGGRTTSYAYTWRGSTQDVASVLTSLPVVGTGQNGSGTAAAVTTVFDPYGRPIWSKDAAGFLTYVEYDAQTGAVTKAITDVNHLTTADFANLPSGWTTPAGGGLHLITRFEVDALGRTTKRTDPRGTITYTVYDDVAKSVRAYAGWTGTAATGPTQVVRDDWAGGYTEALTTSATPTVTGGRPTGAEAVTAATIQSFARTYRNAADQTTNTDAYFSLTGVTYSSAVNLGTEGTNYHRVRYGYDAIGRPDRVESAARTIARTVYDALDRGVSTWVGVDDTPTSGAWSPANTAGTDLVKVGEVEYDGGGIGDSNPTKATAFPGGSAVNRVTQTWYDWRNRPVAVKQGVEATEATGVNRPITYLEYDNLGEVTAAERYDGDAVTPVDANADGVPDKPVTTDGFGNTNLRARATAEYDDWGRVFRSRRFWVNPVSGAVSTNSLRTEVWSDARGLVVKEAAGGGLVTKSVYDGAGRTVSVSTTDGGGDAAYADASTLTGDAVYTTSEAQYDANGNLTQTTSRERFHNAAVTTGPLGTPSSTTLTKARVSYAGAYYDLADRLTDAVDVGTNGGAAWTRPTSPIPARSDTVLVSSVAYDAAGRVFQTTDPKGIAARTTYDLLGRTTRTVQNYVNGVVSDADDKTTDYTYSAAGLTNLTVQLTGGGVQTTNWVYGVTTATGSGVNSNDLVRLTRWPDPTTGAASASQQEAVTVNALGETLTTTDRNGSVHTLTYDALGRVVSDAVTTLGAGVDGGVRRIDTAYDGQGNAIRFTSYNSTAGGTAAITNEVLRDFNGLGQLITEWQSHTAGAAVNFTTTPKVVYSYSFSTSGTANHSRLTTLTYPNGRQLTHNYSGGSNSVIGRLSSISDASGTLEGYDYLGLGRVVRRAHPLAAGSLDLTYIRQGTGDPAADSGADDLYTGLDLFGRVRDQRWINTNTSTATDRFQYSYDRDSNRTARTNAVNAAFNEGYTYDNLNQLTGFTRGSLTKSWAVDAAGNWASVTTNGTPQTRTHNRQNEILTVGGATSPTYDANGNTTTDETGKQYVYDAWNRLAAVKNSGGTVIKTYTYDGLGRRATETVGATTTDLYYSANWQVLEERVGGVAKAQYVWSPVYVDALILRDRDADNNVGTGTGGLEERLWVQQDANWNVTALVNTSGTVVERYAYDPYGGVTVLSAAWGTLANSAYGWQYLHQGGRLDTTSGFYHFRMRDYSPTLGRWVSMDPIGYAAGDVNLYRAMSGSPTRYNDPSGLEVPGYHHFYSLFLGGDDAQPLFELTKDEHTAAHEVLRKHGVGRTKGVSYDQARAAWAAKTPAQQRAIMMEAMKAANVPEPVAAQYMDEVFEHANPGKNNSPLRGTRTKLQSVSRARMEQMRAAAALAVKLGTPIIAFGVTFFYDQSVQAGEKSGTKLAERIGLGEQLKISGDLGELPSTSFKMKFRDQIINVECIPDPADSQGGHFITAFYYEEVNRDFLAGVQVFFTLGACGMPDTVRHDIVRRKDDFKTYGFTYKQK